MASLARGRAARPHPLTTLREAVIWAMKRGHVLAPGVLGVHCTGTKGLVTWARDRDPTIDPFGALLIMAQPQAPDVDRAIAIALGREPPAYIEGLRDGVAKRDPSNADVLKKVTARLYLAGFEHGVMLRLWTHLTLGDLERVSISEDE